MRKLAILCVFAFACGDAGRTATTEQPIHKGDAAPDLVKRVFLLEAAGLCSSAAIHYPRCIVSAAHCGDFSVLMAGEHPFIDANPKTQLREKLERYDSTTNDYRHDLEIAWLKNLTPGQKNRLQVADYDPMEPIVMSGTTFGMLEIEQVSLFLPNKFDADKAGTAGIAGYGKSKNGGIVGGAGELRKGEVFVTNYFGTSFRTHANDSKQEICGGDSGGPLMFEGGLLGVNSQSDHEACNGTGFAYHTAFDTLGIAQKNNYDWTMDTIEEICTKWQTVKIEGDGTVAGGIIPTQARPVGGLRGNDKIQCPGDCQENFHAAAPNRAAQTMAMTATPAAGWSFSHWSSESKVKKCQCDGSGNASCTVEEGPMGYYDPDTSSDEDVCIAHFVKDMDGGGYDSGNDSGTDSGNDPDADADADAGDSD